MDLHAWITQQVDDRERLARAALATWTEPIPPGPLLTELVEYATANFDLPEERFTALAEENRRRRDEAFPERRAHITANDPAAVLRRCEADRRILARHNVDPDEADSPMYATACKGCERWGEFDYPNTENVNDCPELLDLAHAHGITDDILASLDRPQPPEPKPHAKIAHTPSGARQLAQLLGIAPYTPMTDVPAALRGPHWKP